ncbi:hypothetical protein [Paracidovorax valerianellae]|uniref:Uncharacterized protein n=1 Tax=Paracidovorax valerianellae TaxID=187868 RepID=A0A1G6ULV9_9BURK|nr:hypothetical protein [Paracidovorax valerianellae]MDA8446835.1 hypothetical protein [Paracidovorax valerianellae]SDD41706.1 hypothetical protein SAMN05192589_106106 [Paracidovorax valerianellae]
MNASNPPDESLNDRAAPDAQDLERGQARQPDGPNVAPSPTEHLAARGQLPAGRAASLGADAADPADPGASAPSPAPLPKR